jgi:protein-S-isoprenylcysteine O-methyltransferase Ste14
MRPDRIRSPLGATNPWICTLGFVVAVSVTALLPLAGLKPFWTTIVGMSLYAVIVAVLELVFLKVHRRETTGLDWSRSGDFNLKRSGLKLLGLLGSIAAVMILHWVVAFYQPASLKAPLAALIIAAPYVVAAAAVYIPIVDRAMKDPHDGYWAVGRLLLGRTAPWSQVRDHALGWLIKGFFWPIMFQYLFANMLDYGAIPSHGFVMQVEWLTRILVSAELVIVTVGYLATLRVLDSQIRSPNPTVSGWLVTLVCYEPFSIIIFGRLLAYRGERDWTDVAAAHPWLGVAWGTAILLCYAFWTWATSMFGLRWSNLTSRGVVTRGPFRWTKHPEYLSKNMFWWLSSVPFLTASTPAEALRHTLLLVCTNLVYYGRALVEERHMEQDPAYVEYRAWIAEHGLFSRLRVFRPRWALAPAPEEGAAAAKPATGD